MYWDSDQAADRWALIETHGLLSSTAFLDVTDDIRREMESKTKWTTTEHVASVLGLDFFKKVFSTVDHRTLLQKLVHNFDSAASTVRLNKGYQLLDR